MKKKQSASDNQSAPKRASNAPIVAIGIVALAGVAFLTYTAVGMFVNKLNSNADSAYAASYNNYQSRMIAQATEESPSELLAITSNGDSVAATYVSDDLVQVGDKWYISSRLVEDTNISNGDTSIVIDKNDTVTIDGVEYVYIETPDAIAGTGSDSTIPYYGTEYVVVDIDGNMVYLVEKGDTLSEVSGRVGYSVQELAEFNSIKNVNLIYSGQTLRVPAPQEAIDYVKSQQANVTGTDDAATAATSDDGAVENVVETAP